MIYSTTMLDALFSKQQTINRETLMHPTMIQLERQLAHARKQLKEYRSKVRELEEYHGTYDELMKPYYDELKHRQAELDRLIKAKEAAMGDNL